MKKLNVALPYNGWMARPHQLKLWEYLVTGGKRAIAIWHRRAGKDEIALHWTACAAAKRVGNYVHCLPAYAQARKTIWMAVNPHTGKRRIDEAFPVEWRTNTNETEMSLRFKNGSTWQLIGSDCYDTALVGTSIAGLAMSELALANASAWAYARPILEENNGWALFITTPRGRNHAYDMFRHAQTAPDWFSEKLTVDDTGALTKEQLAETLKEYRAIYGEAGENLYLQEFYCDWAAALIGAIFSLEMKQVRDEGRICDVAAVPDIPVDRSWDLGMRDDTAIWFHQTVGTQLRLLHCLSSSGASLEWWRDQVAAVHDKHGWKHGSDYVPHDAKVRELGTGRTRVETMKALGLRPILAPDASLQDGINALRRTLPLCVFHPRCEDKGIPALEQYQREWDNEKKCFRASPLHDWCSDRVDAARYMALSWRKAPPRTIQLPKDTGWHIPPPSEKRRGGLQL